MKKANKKQRTSKAKGKTPAAPVKPRNRRSVLSLASTVFGGVVLVGGIGFWGVQTVLASVAERDLTDVGQGLPAIVQVHDTQCQPCIALQREARAALKDVSQDDLLYRVADLNSDNGIAFASRYAANYTTLLFFDIDGALVQRLVGPNDRETLTRAFTAHIAASR